MHSMSCSARDRWGALVEHLVALGVGTRAVSRHLAHGLSEGYDLSTGKS
jgi:hypothetical protein